MGGNVIVLYDLVLKSHTVASAVFWGSHSSSLIQWERRLHNGTDTGSWGSLGAASGKQEENYWNNALRGHEHMGSSTKAEGIALVRGTERSSIGTVYRCNCRRVTSDGSLSTFFSGFLFFSASQWEEVSRNYSVSRKQGHRSRMRTEKEVFEVHISSFQYL